MKEKYMFLLALKLLEYEIRELTEYSKTCLECFEQLQTKLDELCQFIAREENEARWSEWEHHDEIREYAEKLRESSVRALCDMEKYQSECLLNRRADISEYIGLLSRSVANELEPLHIGPSSKVLFIGAGALPVSALTIAKCIGAEVMGLDIDPHAVHLAKHAAKASGLASKVRFSNQSSRELRFTKEATHIIVASLVKNKQEVLTELQETIHNRAKVIVRYGNGLKSIFNYPFDTGAAEGWKPIYRSRSNAIYDYAVLEKCERKRMPC
ncbi:hypothetical protein AV654_25905 [Paenibacillus elgii]|uniref:Uncharacterized protein n=1 Tax=Paenibacillus elgii TaxID=189691 RepID=A0A163W5M7_9BACL|nr:nicotianamine synthase family protein [Paenibacillus elgii]KZE75893.1 hypothetical protein AV654_25905 [Paenibacillus elgii]